SKYKKGGFERIWRNHHSTASTIIFYNPPSFAINNHQVLPNQINYPENAFLRHPHHPPLHHRPHGDRRSHRSPPRPPHRRRRPLRAHQPRQTRRQHPGLPRRPLRRRIRGRRLHQRWTEPLLQVLEC
ncbi:hypothetical protein BU24DRAFT_452424, partial [Aaosphaeria arxii CBS 175.79]